MNLKPRFLLFTVLLFAVSALASWWAVRILAESIVEQWSTRYAEKQVLYDKARTLQPILREIALAKQLANSPAIRAWAKQPEDPQLKAEAIAELENYRTNFTNQNYFLALLNNGHYYYNNAENEFADKQYRYTLDSKKKEDSWFFDLIRQNRDLHINVNPDVNLGITKLWIDVLIRDGSEVLGMTGTGLDLTNFIQHIMEEGEPGITNVFVDHVGAIQAHRNQSLIDFSSISKQAGEHKNLDLLFEKQADRDAVLAAMKQLESLEKSVITRFVDIKGKRFLAGVAYLPEIGWYEITLLDIDTLLPLSHFTGILVVYGVTLLVALILFNLLLGGMVLQPLQRLNEAMAKVEAGKEAPEHLDLQASGEIRQLMQRFKRMADSILESRHNLESKVQERTEALDRLSKIDPLTELLNRRGMLERLDAETNRAQRGKGNVGLLWIDVDWFKEINDKHGHATGDDALRTVAVIIATTIRPYDSAARWGGDEFLVLLQADDPETIDIMGERLRSAIASTQDVRNSQGQIVGITASLGGYFAASSDEREAILHNADQALYEAKQAGRNVYRSATKR